MALKVIDAVGGDVDGLTISVLGLTFKPDTDDMRDAPSVPLIETLQRFGATVRAHDPVGMANASRVLENVALFDDPYECARGADAVVVVTEWESIRELDLVRLKSVMRSANLIDLRNAFARGRSAGGGLFAYRASAGQSEPEIIEARQVAVGHANRPDFHREYRQPCVSLRKNGACENDGARIGQ